jgi:hypothetical protein
VPGAVIFVPAGDEALARYVGGLTVQEIPRIAAALGVTTPHPLPIYAYNDRVAFLRDAGATPMLEGVSYHPSGLIRIDATQGGSIRTTLAHELTHSFLAQRLGSHLGELPLWLNEGIAGHLADPIPDEELPDVSFPVFRGRVLTLEEMDQAFRTRGDTTAAYIESRSLVAWLEHHHPGSIRRILAFLAEGASFDDAVYETSGLTPEAWWERWQRSIPNWIFWLTLLSSPVIYVPFALLLAIVAILRHRRRHADEEDEDEPTDETMDDPSSRLDRPCERID